MNEYLASLWGPSTDSRMKAVSWSCRRVEKMSIGCLEVSIGTILGWNVGFVSCWPNSIPHGIFPQHNARVCYLLLACPVLYVSGKKSVCFSRIFGAHPLDLTHSLVESISFLSGKRIELLNPPDSF